MKDLPHFYDGRISQARRLGGFGECECTPPTLGIAKKSPLLSSHFLGVAANLNRHVVTCS